MNTVMTLSLTENYLSAVSWVAQNILLCIAATQLDGHSLKELRSSHRLGRVSSLGGIALTTAWDMLSWGLVGERKVSKGMFGRLVYASCLGGYRVALGGLWKRCGGMWRRVAACRWNWFAQGGFRTKPWGPRVRL